MITATLDKVSYQKCLQVFKNIQGPDEWFPEEGLIEAVWEELVPHSAWMIHDREWLGFALVVAEGDGMLLNPYFFGGVPVVPADHWQLAQDLMATVMDLFNDTDLLRLSSVVYKDLGSVFKQQMLETGGLSFDYDYVDMRCDLMVPMEERPLPEGLSLIPVSACDEQELKDCFDESFLDSDVRYYQNLSAEERRNFYSEVRMEGVLRNPLSVAMVMDGRVLGFVFIYDYDGLPYITSMCMRPGYRGRGIGSYLLHWLKYNASVRGYRELGLGTEMEMRAYGLYRRAGFETIRHRKYFVMKKDR